MPYLRELYSNSSKTGFTQDFFSLLAPNAREALLASPFYSTYDPISDLTRAGCRVKLLIRLCSITTPEALQLALNDENVVVRFYTGQRFHAKFYIIDDTAMVGSANLTKSGLQANREASVILRSDRDAAFAELPGLFDTLWDYSDVLTAPLLEIYKSLFHSPLRPRGEDAFDEFLTRHIPPCEPPTIRVGSDQVTKRRSFLQTFRRRYDEQLVPAFKEVSEAFLRTGSRRPEFEAGDINIEISRFLGWVRVVHAPGESWQDQPFLDKPSRKALIEKLAGKWYAARDITVGDMIYVERELGNIANIRTRFSSPAQINSLSYDEIFDALAGCHAFYEMLRFTSGGVEGLRKDFAKRNPLANIKMTLSYLLHGRGDQLERAYDVIFDEEYRLQRFAEACVMELIGWVDPNRPPINGRTIKALRFLGFQVTQ